MLGDDSNDFDIPKLNNVKDYIGEEKSAMEFSAIGFYLSESPLLSRKDELEKNGFISSAQFDSFLTNEEKRFKMAGIVNVVKRRTGKRGRFAFVHLSDLGGIYEGMIFSDELINQKRNLLTAGSIIGMEVAANKQDEGMERISILQIEEINDAIKSIKVGEPRKPFERKESQQKKFKKQEIIENKNTTLIQNQENNVDYISLSKDKNNEIIEVEIENIKEIDSIIEKIKPYKKPFGKKIVVVYNEEKFAIKGMFELDKSFFIKN
jgi:DNA polymerase III alpha subunit